MKRSTQTALVSSLLLAMSSGLLAESFLPEGQTLPQATVRARVGTQVSFGKSETFNGNSEGQTLEDGHDRIFTAAVLELGLLNNLTAQVKVPYMLQNNSKAGDVESKGATGFTDMEAGFLVKAFENDRILASVGLGMRFPTGSFAEAKDADMTGKGAYDLGLRMNADFKVLESQDLWLSFQDQEEYEIASVERNKMYVDKNGLSRKAFAQVSYGFASASDSMKFLSAKARYAYQHDAQLQVRGTKEQVQKSASLHSVGGGLGISGLEYGIPVSLDALYMVPVTGTDVAEARASLDLTLNAYLQI